MQCCSMKYQSLDRVERGWKALLKEMNCIYQLHMMLKQAVRRKSAIFLLLHGMEPL